MEPTGVKRHRRQPVRVSFREKANQSKRASTHIPEESPTHWITQSYPRREWSRWEASDMDEARRANERERVSQSERQSTGITESRSRMTSINLSPAGMERVGSS